MTVMHRKHTTGVVMTLAGPLMLEGSGRVRENAGGGLRQGDVGVAPFLNAAPFDTTILVHKSNLRPGALVLLLCRE